MVVYLIILFYFIFSCESDFMQRFSPVNEKRLFKQNLIEDVSLDIQPRTEQVIVHRGHV